MRCFRPAVARIGSLLLVVVLMSPYVRAQDDVSVPDPPVPAGQWRTTADMSERREYAGGVRLQDGRILAVSGHPINGKSIASAELYDPATGKWNATGALRQARNSGNGATLLHDGRVLLAGGHSNSGVIRGAEVYDPTTGKWSDAGQLSVGRDPVATLLADGRVLVAGGIDWHTDNGKVYDVAEIYDPATGQWTPTGSLGTPRYEQRAILLDDGRVLAIGGYQDHNADTLHARTELYDPSTGRWQRTGDLPQPRGWFGHAKLSDGRVLVAGGYTGRSRKRNYLASAVVYDPKSGRWSETQPMKDKRGGFAVARLPDGRVLVAGGVAEGGIELKAAELFDPRTETWRPAASMTVARRNHRAALLPDGGVLVIGGSSVFGSKFLKSCEIFRY
jgi:N-acetylneuraminic acid mutarotase